MKKGISSTLVLFGLVILGMFLITQKEKFENFLSKLDLFAISQDPYTGCKFALVENIDWIECVPLDIDKPISVELELKESGFWETHKDTKVGCGYNEYTPECKISITVVDRTAGIYPWALGYFKCNEKGECSELVWLDLMNIIFPKTYDLPDLNFGEYYIIRNSRMRGFITKTYTPYGIKDMRGRELNAKNCNIKEIGIDHSQLCVSGDECYERFQEAKMDGWILKFNQKISWVRDYSIGLAYLNFYEYPKDSKNWVYCDNGYLFKVKKLELADGTCLLYPDRIDGFIERKDCCPRQTGCTDEFTWAEEREPQQVECNVDLDCQGEGFWHLTTKDGETIAYRGKCQDGRCVYDYKSVVSCGEEEFLMIDKATGKTWCEESEGPYKLPEDETVVGFLEDLEKKTGINKWLLILFGIVLLIALAGRRRAGGVVIVK